MLSMESYGAGPTLVLGVLTVYAFVYDVLTFPLYAVLQWPCRKRSLSHKKRAAVVHQDANSITIRSLKEPSAFHLEVARAKIDTMAKIFEYSGKKYSANKCLGTRAILGEEDEKQPNGRVFKKYHMGDYNWKSYSEVDTLSTSFGRGLRELGNKPGKNIAIFAETRAEWMIAAHGIFKQNMPLVTIYATLGDEGIAHAINETEITTVITSFDLLPKFKKLLTVTPYLKTIIYMEDQLKTLDSTEGYKEGVAVIKYGDVIEMGQRSTVEDQSPSPNDIGIIMYTSGSTGVPKGVILLHKNLIAATKGLGDSTVIVDNEIMFGFLPLAHVFELIVESTIILMGKKIGYSSALTMTDNSSKIKRGTKGDASILHPTLMTSVPLILDRISKTIKDKLGKSSGMKRMLFNFGYNYKLKWTRWGFSTPLTDRIVFGALKNLLGGHLRLTASGGAPLTASTNEQIKNCLCMHLICGYGLTETTGSATVQDVYDPTFGRVGPPMTVVDLKLVNWEEGNYFVTDKPHPRGEIMVGGDVVSAGYYKLPEKTNEDFFEADGKRWFRTGDIGEIHSDGVLKIIDRKKDLVKLQAGEYVSLGKVESQLKTSFLVEDICVHGDSTKNACVALVVPNRDHLKEFAARKGVTDKTFEQLCKDEVVVSAVMEDIANHGKKNKLEKFEIPAAMTLVTEVWSPESGLVTAAFKLKRRDIQAFYKDDINRMYAS